MRLLAGVLGIFKEVLVSEIYKVPLTQAHSEGIKSLQFRSAASVAPLKTGFTHTNLPFK